MTFDHVYAWKNNSKRETLHGRRCRVIARVAMNSIAIEFDDGQVEIVSRNSVRRADPAKQLTLL